MKFGKLTDLSAVDFSFPLEPLANAPRLDRYRLGPDDGPSRIYVGPTGWSMKEWVGTWYPPKTKSADYLRHYGQQFNTIEFNTTHYRIPDAELVARWCQSVPADFRFCPKLPQTVSHVGDFGRGSGDFQRFVGVLDGFGEKLGCVFGQLPPYFSAERLPQLEAFLDRWPRMLPLAMEVRHESWFEDPYATEALMDALAARGVAAVITDVAGRRDVLHNYITAPRTMVRFVGNGLVPSDYERLADWAKKLRQWNLPEVYFFPHQPDNVLAPEATAHFVQLLKSQDIGSTRGPADLRDSGQISLF